MGLLGIIPGTQDISRPVPPLRGTAAIVASGGRAGSPPRLGGVEAFRRTARKASASDRNRSPMVMFGDGEFGNYSGDTICILASCRPAAWHRHDRGASGNTTRSGRRGRKFSETRLLAGDGQEGSVLGSIPGTQYVSRPRAACRLAAIGARRRSSAAVSRLLPGRARSAASSLVATRIGVSEGGKCADSGMPTYDDS